VSVGTLTPEFEREGAARARGRAITGPIAILGALTALAAALRLIGLARQGLWFDEANTAHLVHLAPGRMLGLIPRYESTPPLYYMVAWPWAHIFGYGEAGLRSLSALAGVASVPVAFAAGAKLISRRAGLIAAALTACNPFLIWYSQEARSYALLVLLTGGSLWAFAYVRDRPSRRWLVAWVLSSGLALATHYYAMLVVVPEALWLLVCHRRRREVHAAIGVVALCGLALIPLAISQQGTGHASWIAPVSLSLRLGQLPQHFLVGTGAPAAGWLKLAGGLAAALALALAVWRAPAPERGGVRLAAVFVLAGLVINLVLVAVGVDDLITRNVIALWPPALFVLAGGFGAARAGVLGLLGAAGLCAVGIAAAVGVAADWKLQRPDWRPVAQAIQAAPLGAGAPSSAAGAHAVLIQRYKALLPLALYVPRLGVVSSRGRVVDELDVLAFEGYSGDPFCWWGAACNLVRSKLDTTLTIPGFRRVGPPRRFHEFSLLRLRAATPTLLTPHMVARALTTTTLRRDELLYVPGR
jgi:4-amino-4-deoxy-L-arabinose transferase-like glycosyltransferase